MWQSSNFLVELLGENELTLDCGEVAPTDMVNTETSSYSQILLEWVRDWDKDTQQRILLEHMLHRKGKANM